MAAEGAFGIYADEQRQAAERRTQKQFNYAQPRIARELEHAKTEGAKVDQAAQQMATVIGLLTRIAGNTSPNPNAGSQKIPIFQSAHH